MSLIVVQGRNKLSGTVRVQGAKNSILPILSATILCGKPCVIHNCPAISDVDACNSILKHLGCKLKKEAHTITVDPTSIVCGTIPEHLMSEMRSSIVFLGAVLSKCSQAVLSFPGGCELGPRPIDLHWNS